MTNKLIVFSAPSGAGKTTLVKYILKSFSEIQFSISATSREARGEEKDGKDYHFLSSEEFKARIKNDEFIEKQDFYNSKKVEFVHGGDSRQDSIKNALALDYKDFEFVITHDAVRPNISEADIANLYKDILNTNVSCSFLYTPVYDSIKLVGENDITKDKDKFLLVQTPQICRLEDLRNSLNKCTEDEVECPDESYAIEYSNLSLSKVKGRRSNIKIKTEQGKVLANTINGSALAVGRTLIAIIENNYSCLLYTSPSPRD